ncbi:unnamed protein product [Vitrella brassicaformis CCMP3155]|uniref:Small ribosomal subunit protein mS35 mitochondrial conserved domain-containing protein n=2 Tax=Vitrella brassicaformis TaxID=1169539 RepID=A0A0G4FLP9_VITBC|nr:unnamed protein product [Vitrella brassicaformis CCMP3155]|eukprot:CEM14846.1 unnamed protein product [Vitrella brassicaformis CCMP3155]
MIALLAKLADARRDLLLFGMNSFCSGVRSLAGGMAATSSCVASPSVPMALEPAVYPCLMMQQRFKRKKKRKRERPHPTEEQIETKARVTPIRLEDHLGNPEPPYSIAKNIRRSIARMAAGWKRRSDFRRMNRYRVLSAVGLTHDDPEEKVSREGFVTPLTQLQHNAHLPRSTLHARFRFPHTLHYKARWGPPVTEKEPHVYQCVASMRLDDLNLTERQEKRMLDILGPLRYDPATRMVILEADAFPDRNHNAAYLGDILEVLMRKAKKA